MRQPALPYAFNLVVLDSEVAAFARAVRAAPRGLDDGTVYWTERPDCLDAALVLEPERAITLALAGLYVLTVATGDALAGLVPAQRTIAFAWPGHILLDGAELGRVRGVVAPVADAAAVPPWLVLGVGLAVGPSGDGPRCTSLREAGVGDIGTGELLESVGRHFLAWTRRWRDEGLAPVRDAWNQRCHRRDELGEIVLDGRQLGGRVGGLDEAGAFAIGEARLSLAAHLASIA